LASKSPRKTVPEPGSGNRLSDVAYARILEILFERRLPAGAFVSQLELVELTGVPVAPLRDALRVLEAEGVVRIHPRSGIQFVKPGLELTRSTYQFRGIIETAAIVTFAETAPDSLIEELLERHHAVAKVVEEGGLHLAAQQQVEALEQQLHGAIVGSLNNPLITSSYKRIHNYLKLLRLDRHISSSLVLRTLEEHVSILEACKSRNTEAAVAALQAHFAAALQRHLGLY
jgi:DNA-binding GntR family transcriptional regulator